MTIRRQRGVFLIDRVRASKVKGRIERDIRFISKKEAEAIRKARLRLQKA